MTTPITALLNATTLIRKLTNGNPKPLTGFEGLTKDHREIWVLGYKKGTLDARSALLKEVERIRKQS